MRVRHFNNLLSKNMKSILSGISNEPNRGFHIVEHKVFEADYFLGKLKKGVNGPDEFAYILSAFLSATRSITLSLQACKSCFPNFDEWYTIRRDKIRNSRLSQFFLHLRNLIVHIGVIPFILTGSNENNVFKWKGEFFANFDMQSVPSGDVVELAEEYFREVLKLLREFYSAYRVFADPSALFTIQGLKERGWSIEELEESLGFPRGWTDIPWNSINKDKRRLEALKRYGGESKMDSLFEKYGIE
jgi:hypothetical protein